MLRKLCDWMKMCNSPQAQRGYGRKGTGLILFWLRHFFCRVFLTHLLIHIFASAINKKIQVVWLVGLCTEKSLNKVTSPPGGQKFHVSPGSGKRGWRMSRWDKAENRKKTIKGMLENGFLISINRQGKFLIVAVLCSGCRRQDPRECCLYLLKHIPF